MGRKSSKATPAALNVTAFFLRFLSHLGKPFFLLIFLLVTIILSLLFSPVFLVQLLQKALNRIKFARKNKFKNQGSVIQRFKFYITNLHWKFQVSVIALSKLSKKLRSEKRVSKASAFSIKKIALGSILIVILLLSLTSIAFWYYILRDLPSPTELAQRKVQVSTKIYDRNKELLYTIYKDEKRTPVPLEKIPMEVRLAVVAAEDKEFYNHAGFSIRGITRAIIKDIRERKMTGGSTITQQLVKNTLLTPERTLERKLKEFVLAIQVEKTFSKDKILEMYLNEVPFGGTAYGIEEAARTYFDKDVGSLTLAESALLAGLPQSPTKYSPYGANPEASIYRQKQILENMLEANFITSEQKENAANEEIKFSNKRESIKAPHFVFYVRDLLEEKYGKELVEKGGLEVTTTLDYQIQQFTEQIVTDELKKLKNLNVGNASVVVMDPKNGEILAMVGSKDYFDTATGGNVNVAVRDRQPGSAIKVVNYAYALSNGLTAATIIPDTPSTFEVEGQAPYTPKNYEGEFRGNITLRSALAESRNIPAVKVLASYGVKNMIELGTKMGISSWQNAENYGLSLTLGGGEVRLIDLANVFATIANYGKRPQLNSIAKVSDYDGKVLEEYKCNNTNNFPLELVDKENVLDVSAATNSANSTLRQNQEGCGEQVLDPRIAFLITDILKDNSARTPAFGANSLLVVKNHPEVAVKTGTSNDLRDNLAVGYTQDYVVAVWIGNNDNTPMNRIASGVTGATPIFNKIMTGLLSEEKSIEWPVPEKMVRLPICPYTGTFACDGCPLKMEWFLEEHKPDRACNSEWFKKQEKDKDDNKEESSTSEATRKPRRIYERIIENELNDFRNKFR